MKREATRHVAIWIDPHEALLLSFESAPFDRSTLRRSGEGWSCSQDRVDAQQCPSTQQYYGTVLSHLGPQDEILILGPGRAKCELRHQIEGQGGLKGKVVGLYYASRLVEVEVLFPLLAERYERRSVLITSNLVFSEWNRIFKDPMTTACANDRLVHHATILELTGKRYRESAAKARKTDGA